MPSGRQVARSFREIVDLLQTLVTRVLALLSPGALIDLYAGSGLFGLAHAAAGRGPVTLVESDRLALEGLRANARPYPGDATVIDRPVEQFVGSGDAIAAPSVLVDPPAGPAFREALRPLWPPRAQAWLVLRRRAMSRRSHAMCARWPMAASACGRWSCSIRFPIPPTLKPSVSSIETEPIPDHGRRCPAAVYILRPGHIR